MKSEKTLTGKNLRKASELVNNYNESTTFFERDAIAKKREEQGHICSLARAQFLAAMDYIEKHKQDGGKQS